MRTRSVLLSFGALLLLAGATGLLAGLAGAAEEPPSNPAVKVHTDGPAMEKHLLEAVAALMREDAPAARKAMDLLEQSCRRVFPEESEALGEWVPSLDRGFHAALDRSREHAGAGETKLAFDSFFWAQQSCRECHTAARKSGLLPAEGPLW